MKYYQLYWFDTVLTLVISIYLIIVSWSIFIESLQILMLFAPKHIKTDEVITEVLKFKEIKNVHHLHIWQLNDHDIHFEAHLQFNDDISLSKFDLVCEEVEHMLATKFHICHCTFQPEYKRDDSKEVISQN